MSDDIPMTDFSALEREGRSDVERSALRRAGEFYRVIIDMQAAELTALRQRVADMTRALEELAEAAEHDLRLNQDDEHPGNWSLRNERAIAAARAALIANKGAGK